jgi:hypothetical protein
MQSANRQGVEQCPENVPVRALGGQAKIAAKLAADPRELERLVPHRLDAPTAARCAMLVSIFTASGRPIPAAEGRRAISARL